MSGTSFERGDLLLIPFPFTDMSRSKRRPVLAVTSANAYGDFIGLPVTTRPQDEHGLMLTAADLVSGALPRQSWIRTDYPVTLNAMLIDGMLARATDALTNEAVRLLCARLGR